MDVINNATHTSVAHSHNPYKLIDSARATQVSIHIEDSTLYDVLAELCDKYDAHLVKAAVDDIRPKPVRYGAIQATNMLID